MIGSAQLSPRLGKLGRVDEQGHVQPDDMDLDARFARQAQLRLEPKGGILLQGRLIKRN